MPSRRMVALIVLFWLITSSYVMYADIWPRLFSEGPPPLRIDLADEAAHAVPVRWYVFRGDQRIGSLTTRMEYINQNDTFQFITTYSELKFDFSTKATPISIVVPNLETIVQVNRSGQLIQQNMSGKLEARFGGLKIGDAMAEVKAQVVNGELVGRCVMKSPVFNLDDPLQPVPVPAGQVLNPMMPVSRLRDVQPGRRWVIQEVNPLSTAINALKQDFAKKSDLVKGLIPDAPSHEYLAEVSSKPITLNRKGFDPVECWVIDYRSDKAKAKTWVSVADGRVLQQEAENAGETLRFERQE